MKLSVAREAGDRTKVAVRSHNPNVGMLSVQSLDGGANIKRRLLANSTQLVTMLKMTAWYQEENISIIESG